MALPKTINSYKDVANALETAISAGGGRIRFDTKGKAYNWRSRAYYFRKLFAENEWHKAGAVEGYSPPTPYDNMFLTIDNETGEQTGQWDVVIEFRTFAGELLSLDGSEKLEPIEPSDSTIAVSTPMADGDDDLLAEALELAQKEAK